MKKLVCASIIVAAISLILAIICVFCSRPLPPFNVTPRALQIFAGVILLFGVNFGLLALLKK